MLQTAHREAGPSRSADAPVIAAPDAAARCGLIPGGAVGRSAVGPARGATGAAAAGPPGRVLQVGLGAGVGVAVGVAVSVRVSCPNVPVCAVSGTAVRAGGGAPVGAVGGVGIVARVDASAGAPAGVPIDAVVGVDNGAGYDAGAKAPTGDPCAIAPGIVAPVAIARPPSSAGSPPGDRPGALARSTGDWSRQE